MMRREENIQEINISGSSSSATSSRCQDCGNQAKKDCKYLRCRTCCKARGFQCQTHIKSTWIPVSTRRPRGHIMHHHHHHHHHQIPPTALPGPNPKRCRGVNPAHELGFQEGIFPVETSFPAVFRCVRVSTVENIVDQYAYQTSVSIGGHIFTGILYDQGPEPEGTGTYVTGESSNSAGTGSLHQPNFATRTTATGTTPSSSPFYAFTTASSQFFPYPKS